MQRFQQIQVSDITGKWAVFDNEEKLGFIGAVFTQTIPATTWTLQHNMETNCFIINLFTINEDGFKEKIADVQKIEVTSLNVITITLSVPMTGIVEIVFFDPIGAPVPSPTPTQSLPPSPTVTPTPAMTQTITPTLTITPTNTISPTVTITPSSTFTPTPTPTVTPTPTSVPITNVTLVGIYSNGPDESMVYKLNVNDVVDYNVILHKINTIAYTSDIKFDSNGKTLVSFLHFGLG